MTEFVLSFMLLFSQPANAGEKIEWLSWEQMVLKQQAEPRKVLVDIYTNWCGWCKKMDKEVFATELITGIVNEHYYAVKLNAEQKEDITFGDYTFTYKADAGRRGAHELAIQLLEGKMSYPTVVYLNEKLEILSRVPGYQNVGSQEVILSYFAEEAYTHTEWATYQASFESEAK